MLPGQPRLDFFQVQWDFLCFASLYNTDEQDLSLSKERLNRLKKKQLRRETQQLAALKAERGELIFSVLQL
jgi:hypothetical protein